MRYRLATAADVPTCQRLIGHGFSASRRVNARLLQIWRDLIISNPGSLTVIEDPSGPTPTASNHLQRACSSETRSSRSFSPPRSRTFPRSSMSGCSAGTCPFFLFRRFATEIPGQV